jgi:hypothetical protein
LSTKKPIQEQIFDFKQVSESQLKVEEKLNELIELLGTTDLNSENIKLLKQKFNEAADKVNPEKAIAAFRELDAETLSRDQMLDNLSMLLATTPVDSKQSRSYIRHAVVKKIILSLIGITMIVLGMGMIIMPAPPYFEMFTIFYFTTDDGVTLMDLIALLVVLCGVYLLVTTFKRNKK